MSETLPRIKVSIIGIGMVGEPIRRWFQEKLGYKRGVDLFCYDTDTEKGFEDDFNKADFIFVSVPTPPNGDGSCNTSIVRAVVKKINDNKTVIIKSTVPPGTVRGLQKKYPNKRFIFNPEFLTESQSWEDFISPDRQIVSYTKESAKDTVEVLNLLPQKNFIRPWTSDYAKRSVNTTEAELAKYGSNVFGFIKVVYGNILADICYALRGFGAGDAPNYENVREMMSADLRIGPSWLNVEYGSYCGAGGYCFPKDMDAFIAFAEDLAGRFMPDTQAEAYFAGVLKNGINVLKAVRDYNTALLALQNLTVQDVSLHSKEIIVKKRLKIR